MAAAPPQDSGVSSEGVTAWKRQEAPEDFGAERQYMEGPLAWNRQAQHYESLGIDAQTLRDPTGWQRQENHENLGANNEQIEDPSSWTRQGGHENLGATDEQIESPATWGRQSEKRFSEEEQDLVPAMYSPADVLNQDIEGGSSAPKPPRMVSEMGGSPGLAPPAPPPAPLPVMSGYPGVGEGR
eukprot:TRINITY_DN29602_c0_g1_i1.p1 TRINITY_DN29602_c0_g1~~TRINITY_DN29602_c0_g1_i1.p1  ORF type:complete len:184 (+),score=36.04 TRINITY_DN29602_c0_g1_i1:60-611(+)